MQKVCRSPSLDAVLTSVMRLALARSRRVHLNSENGMVYLRRRSEASAHA